MKMNDLRKIIKEQVAVILNENMTDKEYILNLKHGENYTVPESDYGKAEIWLIHETYLLFSIPMYGGIPQFEKSYSKNRIDDMIANYNNWT